MCEVLIVTTKGYRWPFSKGLVIESLINAGLGVEAAGAVAHTVEERLSKQHRREITTEALKQLLVQEVERMLGPKPAARLARQTQSFEEILVEDGRDRRPFSKGLLVRSLEEAGFALREVYDLAKDIEQKLRRRGVRKIAAASLEQAVSEALERKFGVEAAQRYRGRLSLAGEIFVSEPGAGPRMPFSKGILAQSMISAGLSPERAFRIAREMEYSLFKRNKAVIDRSVLRERVAALLAVEAGEEVADRYRLLRALHRMRYPVQILVGGVSGVGKSELASALAYRLGISRLISTDTVREMLRATIPRDLLPTLHVSSFEAWQYLADVQEAERSILTDDLILRGFRDQVARVSVGLRAVQERSAQELLPIVMEGVHLVPGFIGHARLGEVVQVPMLVVVEDAQIHREHFSRREGQTNQRRRAARYEENFHQIRVIQDYLMDLARMMGIPTLPGENLEKALETATEMVANEIQKVYRPGDPGVRR